LRNDPMAGNLHIASNNQRQTWRYAGAAAEIGTMATLDEFQKAIAKAAGRAAPSVVGIGGRWLRGSGVVIAKDRVLTNAHNLRGDGATVVFDADRRERGNLLAAEVGLPVFAVAKSPGGGTRTTLGFVSGRARSFRGPGGRLIGGSVEHTAPMAPGSSGSGIFDAEGRFLGLNTQRIGEGFYLAIPADEALRGRVDALGRGETATRPRLGIAVAPGHVARHMRRAVGLPERDGILVRGVEEGSPAEAAGIREGDLIVSAGGTAIADPDALHEALVKAGSGSVEIGLVRGVEELTVSARLGG
jgi:serine protease Do